LQRVPAAATGAALKLCRQDDIVIWGDAMFVHSAQGQYMCGGGQEGDPPELCVFAGMLWNVMYTVCGDAAWGVLSVKACQLYISKTPANVLCMHIQPDPDTSASKHTPINVSPCHNQAACSQPMWSQASSRATGCCTRKPRDLTHTSAGSHQHMFAQRTIRRQTLSSIAVIGTQLCRQRPLSTSAAASHVAHTGTGGCT
jgi:hypothetical protein